jgi:predicted acyl esterase
MHIYAKLCDVYPDGAAHLLRCGEMLVREADYGHPVEVRMGHIAYRLLPGHRLRLSLASSDYPLFLWHPGTDENPWLATVGRTNKQAITTGGRAPSCVRITTLPPVGAEVEKLKSTGILR